MVILEPVKSKLATHELGDLLKRHEESIVIEPDCLYKQVTVKLWGNGVQLRDEILGSDIAAIKRVVVSPEQFILSKIDARSGAMGVIPPDLDGAVVSNDFPVYEINRSVILPEFLEILCKSGRLTALCKAASEGTTNRVRLREERFLSSKIQLPSLSEQKSSVQSMQKIYEKVSVVKTLSLAIAKDLDEALFHAYTKISEGVARQKMRKAAPLVRRTVLIDPDASYPELGIRSFGKGSFHKPPIMGAELGNKRLFQIAANDLVFNNVFAWEGAIAVAQHADSGRFGSHRFITCLPSSDLTSEFLCFHFLTPDGLEDIRKASPGGAGRNRTLGLDALQNIEVPVPKLADQHWFNELQKMVRALKQQQIIAESSSAALSNAFVASIFK